MKIFIFGYDLCLKKMTSSLKSETSNNKAYKHICDIFKVYGFLIV